MTFELFNPWPKTQTTNDFNHNTLNHHHQCVNMLLFFFPSCVLVIIFIFLLQISQNPSQKYLNKISEVQTHHLKLLQYETSSTNAPIAVADVAATMLHAASPPLAPASLASASSLSSFTSSTPTKYRTQELLSNPVHTSVNQPTTVIIRKDFHSFNFSDIELPVERPTASVHYLRNKHLLHDLSQRSVTGTPKPPTTELDDIFISVKTTKSYHDSRLAMIVKTWFQLAKDQVSLKIFLYLLILAILYQSRQLFS